MASRPPFRPPFRPPAPTAPNLAEGGELLRDFIGSDRFKIQRQLGSGSAGEVYEVYDRKRQSIVALKTLRRVDPAALYRFKKEFRALADVSHRNLVELYELLTDGGEHWFFTMELVKGRTWTEYLLGTRAGQRPTEDRTPTLVRIEPDTVEVATEGESEAPAEPPPGMICSPERLRGALRQLALGLVALHEAGKLHCDLKPSNVLVRRDGRLVLLDLGLVRDRAPERIYESLDEDIVGTPAYMSPEQAAGLRITPASDWYSVGVMVYEALTGRLPYAGSVMKILTDKQKLDPTPPSALLPGIPKDLDHLCMDLLRRDAESRPGGVELLRRLGKIAADDEWQVASSSSTAPPFIGRANQLASLGQAFEHSRQERTIALFVHGNSGMGKSALVHRFLEDLHQRDEDVVVLTGRCFPRESMPYKAFDSLIDSLSRYLRSLPAQEAEALMPYDVLALTRLFPVLLRVKVVAGARRRVLEIQDSAELRRRAFGALRELFLRLSDRHPLVLFIDDLQWGDLDSAALIHELLRPPDPPPMLFIACFRSEEVLTSPLLRTFFTTELTRAATEVRELAVRELEAKDAEALARHLLGRDRDSPQAATLARTIAREAAGNPFFIEALVRYAQAVWAGVEGGIDVEKAVGQATLERAIQARLDRLPTEARRLLGAVAVAGRPLPLDVAAGAALLGDDLQTALAALRALQLVRLRGVRGGEEVEPYHDRIRQVVVDDMSPERAIAYHRSLARTLEETGQADPETLAHHFRQAGDQTTAARYAERAADRAVEALAFDRAARLYRQAVEGEKGQGLDELWVKLADALANSGRGAEAAQVYLTAADEAEQTQALELRRRAAEQLLISGRIDKGLATVRHVLDSVGIQLAKTPAQAKISLLSRRLRLRLRGLHFSPRAAQQVAPAMRVKIDTCWAVSVGLGLVDPIRGMDFGTRALLLALEAGDLYRIARSLALEVAYSAMSGNRRRTELLINTSRRLADEANRPHAHGLANLTAGIAAYLEGHWALGLERLERAEELLRERCTGVTWEIDTAMIFQLRSLLYLGRYDTIQRRLPRLLQEVQERGDLYAETNIRSRVTWAMWLVQDEPKLAEEEVARSIQRWSHQGFHLQHYWHMTGVVETELYTGRCLGAWRRLQALWREFEASLLPRIEFTRLEGAHLRARCALAAAVQLGPEGGETAALLRVASRAARRLKRTKVPWVAPLAKLLEAGIHSLGNRPARCLKLLEQAAAQCDELDMALYAAVARRRRGQMLNSEAGGEEIAAADLLLAEQGIKNPARFADVMTPGAWHAPEPAQNSV